MHQQSSQERDLLALILARDPEYGTAGSILARIHAPNAPGPGPEQRPKP
jgi:hypothetical protein